MTWDELRDAVAAKVGLGHARIQLAVRRKSSPRNWDRVRVIPGVYGRCVGELETGAFLVDVKIDALAKALGFVLVNEAMRSRGEDT